jgi:hypothetical protein
LLQAENREKPKGTPAIRIRFISNRSMQDGIRHQAKVFALLAHDHLDIESLPASNPGPASYKYAQIMK